MHAASACGKPVHVHHANHLPCFITIERFFCVRSISVSSSPLGFHNPRCRTSAAASWTFKLSGKAKERSQLPQRPHADSVVSCAVSLTGAHSCLTDCRKRCLLPPVEASALAKGADCVGKGMMDVVEQHFVPAVLPSKHQSHYVVQHRPGSCRVLGQELVPRQ